MEKIASRHFGKGIGLNLRSARTFNCLSRGGARRGANTLRARHVISLSVDEPEGEATEPRVRASALPSFGIFESCKSLQDSRPDTEENCPVKPALPRPVGADDDIYLR